MPNIPIADMGPMFEGKAIQPQQGNGSDLIIPEGIREDELPSRIKAAVDMARAYEVKDKPGADAAAAFCQKLRNFRTGLSLKIFQPMLDAAKEAVDAAKASLNKVKDRADFTLKPIEAAETEIKTAICNWQLEQRRLAQEAEAKAEIERQAIKKKIEDEKIKSAAEAETKGMPGLAAAILDAPIPKAAVEMKVSTPIPAPDSFKVKGFSPRTYYKWRLISLAQVPDGYKKTVLNEAMIDAFVTSQKEKAKGAIPGIEVYTDSKPSYSR